MDGRRKLVQRGYDALGRSYVAIRDQFKSDKYLRRLARHLRPGAAVLDVGCGAGIPVARFLADQGFRVTGIDLSAKQIELAGKNVPTATFRQMDMTELDFPSASFDAVVSFYAIFHVPRREHRALLRKLVSVLRPGGYVLLTMGVTEWEGTADFHGVDMFWSHYGREKNLSLLGEAGFQILSEPIDRSGGERHLVVLAKKLRNPSVSRLPRGRAEQIRTLSGIKYEALVPSRVRHHVLSVAGQEWDPEDFEEFGDDLRKSVWRIEVVEVRRIKKLGRLMRSKRFLKELRPRIKTVSKFMAQGRAIPPLILRGSDYLVFDGYARLYALRSLGAEKCLAYVGRKD